jgi:cytochrome P450 family 4
MALLAYVVVIILLFFIWYYVKFNERITLAKQLPGPKSYPLIGNALEFRGKSERDIMTSLEKLTKMFGRTTRILIGPHVLVLTTDPKDAEVILSSPKLNDKSDEYRYLVPWLGSGLLVGSGQNWFHRRKIITPTFDYKILEQFVEVFDKHGSIFVEQLAKLEGQTIDVVPLVTFCALDIICGNIKLILREILSKI